ncbi:MAG: hypothetical protein IPO92_12440 [Saprospiraceae bacterium]|nr:hypothetical protein [Saprospiraceae bacterium]
MKGIDLKILSIFFLFFAACSTETTVLDESTFGYDFFPVNKGKSWIYSSDSIIYDNSGTKIDTFRSFIREEIGESFKDDEGNTVYKVLRSFKRKSTDNWSRLNTWTTSIDKTRAIRTEENLKFVKLVFPVKKGLRWNGNIFLDVDQKIDVVGETIEPYKNWKHRMEEIDEIYNFNGQNIPAIHINLVDQTSIIDRRKATEYYGKGIGLLKRELIILDSDGTRPNDPWEEKAQKGFIHILTLIEVN